MISLQVTCSYTKVAPNGVTLPTNSSQSKAAFVPLAAGEKQNSLSPARPISMTSEWPGGYAPALARVRRMTTRHHLNAAHRRGYNKWVAPGSPPPYFSWGHPSLPRLPTQRTLVLYICIPAYNEAQTVGVLLW